MKRMMRILKVAPIVLLYCCVLSAGSGTYVYLSQSYRHDPSTFALPQTSIAVAQPGLLLPVKKFKCKVHRIAVSLKSKVQTKEIKATHAASRCFALVTSRLRFSELLLSHVDKQDLFYSFHSFW